MTTVPSWLILLVYIGGGIAAMTSIWKVIRAFTKAFHRIAVVAAELQPNGGASLRDVVNKITVASVEAAHKADVAVSVAEETRREAKSAATDARIAATEARAAVAQATEVAIVANKAREEVRTLASTVENLVKAGEEFNHILHELKGHAQASAIVVAPVIPKSPTDRRS